MSSEDNKLGHAIKTLAAAHTPQPRRNYVLWTGGYVDNGLLLWRKEHRGYTSNLNDAHRFTKEEAERQHKVRETDIPINLALAAPGFVTVINPEVMKGDDSDKLWEDINKYRR